ncbi:MAG: 16S rRNA (adenine(1518)-N(6)/adenine(1519)-N(6))-dimethyltransferase RsmA [Vallitaleaceae bacterium]|jgi:16S rRNA (adenine1518-N6/adenine1519-N6)-dimethyltransferase|nr:16S rRNA (adenine(1518)-N(6)/adenine(1519)-N(6))-dimethyltransferase RsmA [Vallitaleaceae bacterium]
MIERISNPSHTKAIVEKYQFAFQKRLGQNFLIDQHVLEKIISGSEVSKEDIVIEIGPGIGSLTQYLCEAAGKVIAIEIDKQLIPILEDTLSSYDNLELINADILAVDLHEIVKPYAGKSIKVIANLPYYITTPIIMHIFEKNVPIDSITIMIQKEVADRIKSPPNSKIYGALSLAVQFHADTHLVTNVPPTCFMPRPKVGSSVIRLTKYKIPPVNVVDSIKMFKIIRASFNQRRKTLVNTMHHQLGMNKEVVAQSLESINIMPTIRGEALSLEQFAMLTNVLVDRGLI